MSAVDGESGSSKLTFTAKGAYLIWRAPVRPVPLDSQLKVMMIFCYMYFLLYFRVQLLLSTDLQIRDVYFYDNNWCCCRARCVVP